jgi:hypothetical protein
MREKQERKRTRPETQEPTHTDTAHNVVIGEAELYLLYNST